MRREPSQNKYCPHCGDSLPGNNNFCINCGEKANPVPNTEEATNPERVPSKNKPVRRGLPRVLLRIVASVLIIWGIFCIVLSDVAIGDIGFSMAMAGTVGILSGIGLWLVPVR